MYKSKNVSLSLKKFLSIIACAFVALSAHAQKNQTDQDAHFFAHAGISTSAIQGGAVGGFNKINFLAGVGVLIPKGDEWRIGIEGNITQKGTRKVADGPSAMIEQYRANLIYGQVAGYAELAIGGDFSVYLGPGIGYLLSSSETDFNGPVTGPSKTNFTDFELSVLGGVKYTPINHLSTYFRFDQSILPIVDTGLSNNNITGIRQFHTVLAIGLIFTL